MKVIVAVKRVIDYKTTIRVKSDQTGVETANVKMSMNPFDEIAMEEAVRLKEKNIVTEIIAVSIGVNACQEILRAALAMGADRAILIETDTDIQALAAAKIFAALTAQEQPHLFFLGKQAIDDDNNQTGQMLAGLLGWSQGTFASRLEINHPYIKVTRETDGGLETLKLIMPAVITTDLRLNEPRYISLPNIVQAKRKPLNIVPLTQLQLDTKPRLNILSVTAPEKRKAGVKLKTIAELMEKLKNEARVLA